MPFKDKKDLYAAQKEYRQRKAAKDKAAEEIMKKYSEASLKALQNWASEDYEEWKKNSKEASEHLAKALDLKLKPWNELALEGIDALADCLSKMGQTLKAGDPQSFLRTAKHIKECIWLSQLKAFYYGVDSKTIVSDDESTLFAELNAHQEKNQKKKEDEKSVQ